MKSVNKFPAQHTIGSLLDELDKVGTPVLGAVSFSEPSLSLEQVFENAKARNDGRAPEEELVDFGEDQQSTHDSDHENADMFARRLHLRQQ